MHYEAFIPCGSGKLLQLLAGARQPYRVATPHGCIICELLEEIVFSFHANLAGSAAPETESYIHIKPRHYYFRSHGFVPKDAQTARDCYNPQPAMSIEILITRRTELGVGKGNWVEQMMERKLTIAEIILIAGTRVALGAGIGLLLSTRAEQ